MYYGTPPIVTNGLVLNLDPANSLSIATDPTVNLFTNSENYVSPWGTNNSFVVTSSAYPAPYGTGSANLWSITGAFSNITRQQTLYQGIYTFSWFVKYINQQYYYLVLEGATYGVAGFDILNGVKGNIGGNGRFINSFIESAPNGYYRIGATLNVTESSINSFPLLWPGGYTGFSYSGSQAYIWGAQLERNSYMSPYAASTNILGRRNTWRDISGNNNVATLTTASISSSIPQYSYLNERVLNFDGSGSYAIVNSSILQDSGGTINMWVYPIGTSSGYIFAAFGTNSDRFYINRFDGVFSFSRGNPLVAHGKSSVPSGVWYNVTLTWDSSSFSSYVNGVYNLTSTYVASGSTSLFTIGAYMSPLGSQGFTGKIGSTQIHNRPLTQAEITQNFNAYKSRYGL